MEEKEEDVRHGRNCLGYRHRAAEHGQQAGEQERSVQHGNEAVGEDAGQHWCDRCRDAAGLASGPLDCLLPPASSPLTALARSEEHTSELQSLMRISYAVFCLKKNKKRTHYTQLNNTQQILSHTCRSQSHLLQTNYRTNGYSS